MKEESILNVLMYLFKNHLDDKIDIDSLQDSLAAELEELGFQRAVIIQAFEWLGKLASDHGAVSITEPQGQSFRVYSPYEYSRLTADSIGLICFLEEQGILTPKIRELVISQALDLEIDEIDVSLIKWVTLMVLFSQPECQGALACMEYLVLENSLGSVH